MLSSQNHAQMKVVERLIEYQNPTLMRIFQKRYLIPRGLNYMNLDDLFLEFKKFIFILFLVQTRQSQIEQFTVIKQLELLDEIWHQFILMTSDYHHFCFELFGCFIHHEPDDRPISSNGKPTSEYSKSDLMKQIDFVKQVWGHETAQTWYIDLPYQTNKSMVKKWLYCLHGK